ncbi:zinc-finger domain-containing protein [Cytobacillus firmus]|uniref:zinc-finger domain-containing protein n=1 Tax=Cytobacillus firmus TaxID=1399 RepID=UPI0018CD089A|nr:zinc-finger domain-containing protein [Cytobacillus firmus]MBG9586891.1 hypothetical protein [Cytobacillus firmus]
MSREEKRKIRKELNDLMDSHCNSCEFRSGYEGNKQCLSNCQIGEQLRSFTAMLVKDPISVEEEAPVKKGRWQEEEEIYLLNHLPYFSVEHIAMRLNRHPNHVSGKIHRLKSKRKHVC